MKRVRRILIPAVLAVIAAAAAFPVSALEYGEVKSLVQSQVAEEVILNMVGADGTLFITMEQADEMRGLGASENLIIAMRPTAVSTTSAGAEEYYSEAPVVVQSAQPQVVTQAAGPAEGSPITPVSISMSSSYPPRYNKEGWLSISNHDWVPYYILINQGDKRIFISRSPNGGMAVASGQNTVVNLKKETYKMYGDSGNKLEVKVRENEATRLSLNPFGVFGNSGLTGVAVDRDRVRNVVLFNNYVPAPAIIVQEAPVIVAPPPPVYYRPPYYHRPYHGGGSSFHFRYRR